MSYILIQVTHSLVLVFYDITGDSLDSHKSALTVFVFWYHLHTCLWIAKVTVLLHSEAMGTGRQQLLAHR